MEVCRRLLGVIVCRGEMGVNATLAGDIIIDPALRPGEVPGKPQAVLLTHGHADHYRYAHLYRASIYAPRHCTPLVENPSYNHMATMGWAGPVEEDAVTRYFLGRGVRVDVQVEPGRLFDNVEAHPAPGHTPGHLVYIVETGEARILVAGDVVYGHDYLSRTPILYHTDTVAWRGTLERLGEEKLDAIIPGHGEPVAGRAEARRLLEANIAKIDEMLRVVLEALPGPGKRPMYGDEVAAEIARRLGYTASRRAYSVLGPTVRALLHALRHMGLASEEIVDGVPAWRRNKEK